MQPVQVTVIVKLPPAGVGCSRAFHVGRAKGKGVKGSMSYGGHTALGQGRTPQPGPKGCAVTFRTASTEYSGAPPDETVRRTPVAALLSRKPYTAAAAGARWSTMLSPKAASKPQKREGGGGGARSSRGTSLWCALPNAPRIALPNAASCSIEERMVDRMKLAAPQ